MTASAKSVLVHGIYLAASGALLIASPNTLLSLLGLAPTNEVWIRIVGVLTLILGFYFVQAARKNVMEFIRWTITARFTFLFFIVVFVLFGLANPIVILFGLIDLLGALWTLWTLRVTK